MAKQSTVNPSEEIIRIGPLAIRFLLTGEDTNDSVSVFEVTVPAGQKLAAPAHKNDAYEETLYGIAGTLTWTIDGNAIEVGPGQAVCIPRGAVHRFDNFGTEEARQLSIVTPAIMGPAYFREARAVINAAPGRPPDTAKMIEIFRRHGMTIAALPPMPGPQSLTGDKQWKRVVLVGLDPATVDFSDPALPPGMTAEKIREGVKLALTDMAARGWVADVCYINPDDTAVPTLERHLAGNRYDCVVIGAGVRLPPNRLELFERLLNAIHRVAPQTAIAFNTRPDDSGAAAARWI